MSDLADELERLLPISDEDGRAALDFVEFIGANLPAILAALRSEPDAAEVERAAEAVYMGLYGNHGARWHAVGPKDLWRDIARAALTAARTPPTLTETVAACRSLPWPGAGHD